MKFCDLSNLRHSFRGLCAGIGFGDPHIKTLDGLDYTYNGLGQYILVKTAPFELQGRTIQVRDKDKNLVNATIWGAFAARDIREIQTVVNDTATTSLLSTTVHVELSEDRTSE